MHMTFLDSTGCMSSCHHVSSWIMNAVNTGNPIDVLCRRRITWSLQSKTATHICFHLASIWRILHARVAFSNSTSEGCFAAPSFLKHDLGQWCILPFFNLSSMEIPTKNPLNTTIWLFQFQHGIPIQPISQRSLFRMIILSATGRIDLFTFVWLPFSWPWFAKEMHGENCQLWWSKDVKGKMQRCAYDRMLVKLPSSLPIVDRDGWFAAFKSSIDLHPKTKLQLWSYDASRFFRVGWMVSIHTNGTKSYAIVLQCLFEYTIAGCKGLQ